MGGAAKVAPVSLLAPPHPAMLPDLHAVLADGTIIARYQPIVRMSDASLCGVETLARLAHPARGMLLPACFVPAMEGAGMWWQLMEQITNHGLAELAGPALRPFGINIGFNLPLPALLSQRVLADLDARRASADLRAEQVMIELTESHPVDDIPQLARALERWRARGYAISIDDIGPDVHNYRALMSLPFAAAKLDKSLVTGSGRHPAMTRDFLGGLVAAAHKAGLIVIAEGIEQVSDWAEMRALGVDWAQGYAIARPLPAAALPVWMRYWERHGADLLL